MNALEQLKARFALSGMPMSDDEVRSIAVRVSGSVEAYLAYCTDNDAADTAQRISGKVQSEKWTDAPTVTTATGTYCFEEDRVIAV